MCRSRIRKCVCIYEINKTDLLPAFGGSKEIARVARSANVNRGFHANQDRGARQLSGLSLTHCAESPIDRTQNAEVTQTRTRTRDDNPSSSFDDGRQAVKRTASLLSNEREREINVLSPGVPALRSRSTTLFLVRRSSCGINEGVAPPEDARRDAK